MTLYRDLTVYLHDYLQEGYLVAACGAIVRLELDHACQLVLGPFPGFGWNSERLVLMAVIPRKIEARPPGGKLCLLFFLPPACKTCSHYYHRHP